MFKELLKRLAVALDDAGLPYMVFGGQAVLLYGEPRLTRDIDITVGIGPEEAASLMHMTEELGLQMLVDRVHEFIHETFVLPVMEPTSGIRVDFVFSLSEFERTAIRRGKMVKLQDVDVRFVSLEDLIVMKIISGRPRDLDDAAAVIRKNPGFDRAHVERWLRQFDMDIDGRFLCAFEQVMAKTEVK